MARVIVGNFESRYLPVREFYELQKSCFKADKTTYGYESILNNLEGAKLKVEVEGGRLLGKKPD
jgi:hypothetical protein